VAAVSISVCSLDEDMAEAFEPRALPRTRRLDLIEKLRDKGVTCGAFLMPIFPYITDSEEHLEGMYAEL